jgi:hypothetical protein
MLNYEESHNKQLTSNNEKTAKSNRQYIRKELLYTVHAVRRYDMSSFCIANLSSFRQQRLRNPRITALTATTCKRVIRRNNLQQSYKRSTRLLSSLTWEWSDPTCRNLP